MLQIYEETDMDKVERDTNFYCLCFVGIAAYCAVMTFIEVLCLHVIFPYLSLHVNLYKHFLSLCCIFRYCLVTSGVLNVHLS